MTVSRIEATIKRSRELLRLCTSDFTNQEGLLLMRLLIAAALGTGFLATPLLAQDAPAAAPAVIDVNPEMFTDADRSPEAIKKGEAFLAEVQAAYKKAPAITETISIAVKTPMGDQNQKMSTTWGAGDSFIVSMEDGAQIITSDGKAIFMEIAEDKKKFIKSEIGEAGVMDSLMMMTGGQGLPDPASSFRLSKKAENPQELTNMLSMGTMPNPKVTAFRSDGKSFMMMLAGEGATSIVVFDGKTKLITQNRLAITPPNAPPGLVVDVNFNIDVKVLEKLPKAIAFDAGDRTAVSSFEELGPQPVKVGDTAPTFSLTTLSGDSVDLASLKGEVVVLDFWATWCGPCKRGLPELQKVVDWIEENKLPVKVYGVDVWEQGSTEAKIAAVRKFWSDQKFTFPTLLDLDDSVVAKYGLTGIPGTFIIGQDGKVMKFHGGFDPGMAENLKKELTEALSSAG